MRLISDVMQPILPSGMRAPTRPAHGSWRSLALGAVLVSLGGCKASSSAAAKSPAADLDDITAIESELAVNAERLEAQGVRLTRVTKGQADKAGAVAQDPTDDDETDTDAPEALPPTPASEPAPDPVVEAEEAAMSSDTPELNSAPRGSRSKSKAAERRSRDKKTRCERICDLAEATCTLADRICELADEHVDDVRYEDACDRAGTQCEAASDACSACED
ncbi:MAG: hypothetical protein KUG77_25350 [Nannocystaceae bacterium]|nr:hypothetical protein [Nannocystaceae bacterium]